MKITFKGDYALKALLVLSLHYPHKIVTIQEIAAIIDAPIKFLEQVLLGLKKGGFVRSRRGNVGGYLLARPPREIRLGDVVRFIEGPVQPIACVDSQYRECREMTGCVFRPIWRQVDSAVSRIIDGITFEELAQRAQNSRQELVYSI